MNSLFISFFVIMFLNLSLYSNQLQNVLSPISFVRIQLLNKMLKIEKDIEKQTHQSTAISEALPFTTPPLHEVLPKIEQNLDYYGKIVLNANLYFSADSNTKTKIINELMEIYLKTKGDEENLNLRLLIYLCLLHLWDNTKVYDRPNIWQNPYHKPVFWEKGPKNFHDFFSDKFIKVFHKILSRQVHNAIYKSLQDNSIKQIAFVAAFFMHRFSTDKIETPPVTFNILMDLLQKIVPTIYKINNPKVAFCYMLWFLHDIPFMPSNNDLFKNINHLLPAKGDTIGLLKLFLSDYAEEFYFRFGIWLEDFLYYPNLKWTFQDMEQISEILIKIPYKHRRPVRIISLRPEGFENEEVIRKIIGLLQERLSNESKNKDFPGYSLSEERIKQIIEDISKNFDGGLTIWQRRLISEYIEKETVNIFKINGFYDHSIKGISLLGKETLETTLPHEIGHFVHHNVMDKDRWNLFIQLHKLSINEPRLDDHFSRPYGTTNEMEDFATIYESIINQPYELFIKAERSQYLYLKILLVLETFINSNQEDGKTDPYFLKLIETLLTSHKPKQWVDFMIQNEHLISVGT